MTTFTLFATQLRHTHLHLRSETQLAGRNDVLPVKINPFSISNIESHAAASCMRYLGDFAFPSRPNAFHHEPIMHDYEMCLTYRRHVCNTSAELYSTGGHTVQPFLVLNSPRPDQIFKDVSDDVLARYHVKYDYAVQEQMA